MARAKARVWPGLSCVCRVRSSSFAEGFHPHVLHHLPIVELGTGLKGRIPDSGFGSFLTLADTNPESPRRNLKRFRGGLVIKAHRLLYHSTLGLRVIKRREKKPGSPPGMGWSPSLKPIQPYSGLQRGSLNGCVGTCRTSPLRPS